MKDRITQFLKSERISPAEFADKIGVQRSSVSHVLNGRNYPSASFIQKMLEVYRTLNSRWLLMGEGPMFESKSSPFAEPSLPKETIDSKASSVGAKSAVITESNPFKNSSNQLFDNLSVQHTPSVVPNPPSGLNSAPPAADLPGYTDDSKGVDRIVFFFKDKTFAVYTPSK